MVLGKEVILNPEKPLFRPKPPHDDSTLNREQTKSKFSVSRRAFDLRSGITSVGKPRYIFHFISSTILILPIVVEHIQKKKLQIPKRCTVCLISHIELRCVFFRVDNSISNSTNHLLATIYVG